MQKRNQQLKLRNDVNNFKFEEITYIFSIENKFVKISSA